MPAKYERLRKMLAKAGAGGLHAETICKRLDTKNPMSLVRELEQHGWEVERHPGKPGDGKGTRVVLAGRKWADHRPGSSLSDYDNAGSGSAASRHLDDEGSRATSESAGEQGPPSLPTASLSDAADRDPASTYTETTINARGEVLEFSQREVERTGTEDEPEGPGVVNVLVTMEQVREWALRTGRMLPPEYRDRFPADTHEFGYVCATCRREKPEPGKCACGDEDVASINVYRRVERQTRRERLAG